MSDKYGRESLTLYRVTAVQDGITVIRYYAADFPSEVARYANGKIISIESLRVVNIVPPEGA